MTVTENLIREINMLVTLVDVHAKAFAAEEKRHADTLSAIETKYRADVSALNNQSFARQQQLSGQRDAALQLLNQQHARVRKLENTLSASIPRSRVQDMIPATQVFNEKEAESLLAKIHEGGFWTFVKKLLSIGGYKTNGRMAADLYGQLDNANRYLNQKKNDTRKNYDDRIRLEQQSEDRQKKNRDSQRNQDVQGETVAHRAKRDDLERRRLVFMKNPGIDRVRKLFDQAALDLGVSEGGWKKYVPARTVPQDILLGLILHPCAVAAPSAEASRMLAAIPGYIPKENSFRVPMTVSARQPVLLYTACDMGSVSPAAGVYQSVIGRMIRFLPMKSFRSIFFDPVNRGTSLGELIHLAGEGTSRLCEYHLSGQDIDTHMKKLTEHVDKVCNRLTKANVADINAYNAAVSTGRIPYTAVVIHDFPQGFGSSSLNALQVLINKAKQCGISLMISGKSCDKVEGLALEVLNRIRSEFIRIQVGGTEKPTITFNGNCCRYKPMLLKIENTYLQEVNKAFTYKPPIVNDFARFFDLDRLPPYRDSTTGLSIPFAVTAAGEILELNVGQDLTAYGLLTGSVGSGKSTLLHMLISSAVMHYHPSQLELWLMDYKETEFAFYVNNCPPHVRHVVADESLEISYSMIDEIQAECKRRRSLFTSIGVENYVAYRGSDYQRRHPLPRLLVIIDEFHRMAQAVQNDTDYKVKLENIFAEARSSGISLLLCDQALANGLSGLSEKSRALINVRIAMRNPVQEIRETLAVENALITEQVKEMMLSTSSGGKGTLLYKYEAEDPNDPMGSRQVKFQTGRALYITQAERQKCVARVAGRAGAFDREKSFFVGAKREPMDIQRIKRYEKQNPQTPEQGNRFYIGTPMGIQPCISFNHKPGEGGENILLVGSNHEKRLAILRSVVSCAQHYGYKLNILAARRAQLYQQNKEFFNQLSGVNLITTFPEICQYIGQHANQLRALYDEDGDDIDVTPVGRELTIFIGPDEMYSQMEASNLNQQQAWSVETRAAEPPKKPERSGSGFGFRAPAEPGDFGGGSLQGLLDDLDQPQPAPETLPADEESSMGGLLGTLDSLLAGLDDDTMTASVPEVFAGEAAVSIRGYNAVEDFALLISSGWKLGIHSMLVLDKATAMSQMRRIKKEGNFNHRIALVMSADEALNILSRARVMQSLAEKNDTISAVYEYMGSREIVFRPYIF